MATENILFNQLEIFFPFLSIFSKTGRIVIIGLSTTVWNIATFIIKKKVFGSTFSIKENLLGKSSIHLHYLPVYLELILGDLNESSQTTDTGTSIENCRE